jgi:hypothetical protein
VTVAVDNVSGTTYTESGSCFKFPKHAGHRRRRYSDGRVNGGGSGNGFLGGGVFDRGRLRDRGPGVGDADDEDGEREASLGMLVLERPREAVDAEREREDNLCILLVQASERPREAVAGEPVPPGGVDGGATEARGVGISSSLDEHSSPSPPPPRPTYLIRMSSRILL